MHKFNMLTGMDAVVLLCTLVVAVNSFKTGAPPKACQTMMPGHSVAAQMTPPPYIITVSTTEYKAMQTITVTVQGKAFKGILLQARKADGTPVGTFSSAPTDTKLVKCTNDMDSWTHANTNDKTNATITWNAPYDMGPIVFIATVAQEKNIFWKSIVTPAITSATNNIDPAGNSGNRTSTFSAVLLVVVTIFAALQF